MRPARSQHVATEEASAATAATRAAAIRPRSRLRRSLVQVLASLALLSFTLLVRLVAFPSGGGGGGGGPGDDIDSAHGGSAVFGRTSGHHKGPEQEDLLAGLKRLQSSVGVGGAVHRPLLRDAGDGIDVGGGVDGEGNTHASVCGAREMSEGGHGGLQYDAEYDRLSAAVERSDEYSSIHCIEGEPTRTTGTPPTRSSSSGTSDARPPMGVPYTAPASTHGFPVVNRSCFFTNVLFRHPNIFTLFIEDTPEHRRLHREGRLVPPVTLPSRPYDLPSVKKFKQRVVKRMISWCYDWRPDVVFGPVPRRGQATKSLPGTKATVASSSVPYCAGGGDDPTAAFSPARRRYCAIVGPEAPAHACDVVGYYTPIVAPWNYAHTLFCDLFGLFWAAYEFVFAGAVDWARPAVERWHWTAGGTAGARPGYARVRAGEGEGEGIHGGDSDGGAKEGKDAAPALSSHRHIETRPEAAEAAWRRSRALLKGHRRPLRPFPGLATDHSGGDGNDKNDGETDTVAELLQDALPRVDLQVAAVSSHFGKEFPLPNKNKAFEMFSRRPTVYDFGLQNNTIYRGLLAGIGTKSWSWVTEAYAASGSAHVWYAFRQHVADVTGAADIARITGTSSVGGVSEEGGSAIPAGAGSRRRVLEAVPTDDDSVASPSHPPAEETEQAPAGTGGGVPEVTEEETEAPPTAPLHTGDVAAPDTTGAQGQSPKEPPRHAPTSNAHFTSNNNNISGTLRVSICHKKNDKRGVVNYDEIRTALAEHFAPLQGHTDKPFSIEFVLEAAVGRSAAAQVQMMLDADVFLCNEGTLATSFFLMPPGSVFVSLPLVYHGPHLHRLKMPAATAWWREPDLLRPDPRRNTGGNIDWFPQAIPWIRTFWYDAVPLNETRINLPLKGLRNYMPDYNIVLQTDKIAALFEKVLGYMAAAEHPRTAGLRAHLGAASPDPESSSSTLSSSLLGRIARWRDVFRQRAALATAANSQGGGGGLPPSVFRPATASSTITTPQKATRTGAASRRRSVYYSEPCAPTAPREACPRATATGDEDHNYSLNGRLCRAVLQAFPHWTRAFNSARCYYGMSWLCEFWANTRYASRNLHGKWALSGGHCGNENTTIEAAAKVLALPSGKGPSRRGEGGGGGSSHHGLLYDPRTHSGSAVSGDVSSSNSDALNPFLFSVSMDHPRKLAAFLTYDPRTVPRLFNTTDLRVPPTTEDELRAIFGPMFSDAI